jgi:hypothetical protein
MIMKNSSRILILFSLVVLMLNACVTPRRSAMEFLRERENIAVMIVPPQNTYLYYYPVFSPEEQHPTDETSLQDSYLLKDLDQKKADADFINALTDNLRQYNLKVYSPDDFDHFLAFSGKRYIFAIAQAEWVESDKPFTDRALIDTVIYRQDFLLRELERNTWFEFVKVDDTAEDSGMEVLYSTFTATDEIRGRFRYRGLTGEVFYEYGSDLLEPDDMYTLNRVAGRGNARYIFEYLLNRHINAQRRDQRPRSHYYKYNPTEDYLYRSRDDNRFIILEPEEVTQ